MPKVETKNFSIEDFLTLPEVEPPLEFFEGRILQKMSPRLSHGIIQGELIFALLSHIKATRSGRVIPELRCTFGGSSHVFDLCFFRTGRLPASTNPQDREKILIPPDIAIEILSPGQTVGELARKLRSAIRRGVRLGWLIDDRHRTIHVFHPTRPAQILRAGEILSGEDILSGFSLPVDALFGWLGED